eukprot:GHVS01069749.1.p1 GENE.GHVS01069749.1~~GHVS01069749.1.p1  ORF type:complete len:147 (+),score=39.52 GHVS01069749.1:233-673(+)
MATTMRTTNSGCCVLGLYIHMHNNNMHTHSRHDDNQLFLRTCKRYDTCTHHNHINAYVFTTRRHQWELLIIARTTQTRYSKRTTQTNAEEEEAAMTTTVVVGAQKASCCGATTISRRGSSSSSSSSRGRWLPAQKQNQCHKNIDNN